MRKNKTRITRLFIVFTLSIGLLTIGATSVLADTGDNTSQVTPISAIVEDNANTEIDAIAITIIVPPAPDRQPPLITPRRLFPINVAEGYNYEGVRELVRVYELLPSESPEWINTDSFARNGYYYQIAEITRRVDVAHTVREHSEVIEIPSQTNDLAAVIASLEPTMDFIDEDGYVGVLHLDIRSIAMTQDGTRSTSRTVSQTREFPHLSTPDLALIPQTVTANGRTYTLADVDWRAATSNPIDFNSVAQTFTAMATYTRTATSTVATGYTTTATYNGTLTRVSTGDVRFVATFIGTPIVSPVINAPAVSDSKKATQPNVVADGEKYKVSQPPVIENVTEYPVYSPVLVENENVEPEQVASEAVADESSINIAPILLLAILLLLLVILVLLYLLLKGKRERRFIDDFSFEVSEETEAPQILEFEKIEEIEEIKEGDSDD